MSDAVLADHLGTGRRTLADAIAAGLPGEEALALAARVAEAVAALHAAGRVHGALAPEGIEVAPDGVVRLGPAGEGPPAEVTAPEVLRGRRPGRAADVFAAGALAHALLRGRSPFAAGDRLEAVRRVLHEEVPPVGGVPARVEAGLARALAKRPWRRGSARALAEALGGGRDATAAAEPTSISAATSPSTSGPNPTATAIATATPTATPTATATPTPTATPTATATPTPTPTSTATPTPTATATPIPTPTAATATVPPATPTATAPPRSSRRPLLVGLGAASVLGLLAAYAFLPESDAALAAEVTTLVRQGEVSRARVRIDQAARRRPTSPMVEKLRGDVACARRAGAECLRRYRTALAARPALREDPVLRENVRALIVPPASCADRRSAAELLAGLRDPEALPALLAARRSGGLFRSLCTGDTLDRAIEVTRAAARQP